MICFCCGIVFEMQATACWKRLRVLYICECACYWAQAHTSRCYSKLDAGKHLASDDWKITKFLEIKTGDLQLSRSVVRYLGLLGNCQLGRTNFKKLERETGLKPATYALARHRSINWAIPASLWTGDRNYSCRLSVSTCKYFTCRQFWKKLWLNGHRSLSWG